MSNIPSLEFWVDMSNLGVAIALALSFIFGGASLYLSRRLGKVKDAQSAQEKAVSDERMLALDKEVAEARTKQAEAERALLELQERMKPRHLTPEQRARLLEILKATTKGNIKVSCAVSNEESCAFAVELANLLKAAGWSVTGVGQLVKGGKQAGIFLRRRSIEVEPTSVDVLLTAFSTIGFPLEMEIDGKIREGVGLQLAVGAKP